MKHIFVKSYIFALFLLAIACQSGKGRVSLAALEHSFKDGQSTEQADKNGLEIPQGKAGVSSLLLY